MTSTNLHIRLFRIHTTIKKGYTEYGMYFYLIGLSALIGAFFGVAGAGAFILALGIFYWLGGLHAHVEAKVGKNGE